MKAHENMIDNKNEMKAHTKNLKEQYSESDEESDYNSSIEKQMKIGN